MKNIVKTDILWKNFYKLVDALKTVKNTVDCRYSRCYFLFRCRRLAVVGNNFFIVCIK